jgi:hypothetical protein
MDILSLAAGSRPSAQMQAEKVGPEYLREEIRRRVAKGPVTFRLVLQIAKSGDGIDDPQSRGPTIATPSNWERSQSLVLRLTRRQRSVRCSA